MTKCSKCDHTVEKHDTTGCSEWCSCRESWTVDQIRMQREIDAQIELEEQQGKQQLEDVRSLYGESAAKLVLDGWTIDSVVSHVEGTCDRELCTGDHEPRRFELSITLDGAAIEDDLTGELTRMLQLVIDRLAIGITEGTLRDSNGITKGRTTDTKEK